LHHRSTSAKSRWKDAADMDFNATAAAISARVPVVRLANGTLQPNSSNLTQTDPETHRQGDRETGRHGDRHRDKRRKKARGGLLKRWHQSLRCS
jgi:hypothetical protein